MTPEQEQELDAALDDLLDAVEEHERKRVAKIVRQHARLSNPRVH